MSNILIAASGTGGHLFPALAVAEQLQDYKIQWLGVPNRLETKLVPQEYPLHTIAVEGFQQRFGLGTFKIMGRLVSSIRTCRQLLQDQQIKGVFATGGYISAPAIIAARSLGLPVMLHESNAFPGRVTRLFAPWCHTVALGFKPAAAYLRRAPFRKNRTVYVGTPVRSQFYHPQPLDLPIEEDMPLIVVLGGSQGAVPVNKLVRACAPAWWDAGVAIAHLTGDNDPDGGSLQHSQYFPMPFSDNVAALLQRATLVISRAGAGTLTELAIAGTPAILIPYPYAADNHQAHNAAIFAAAGAADVFSQAELTPEILKVTVLNLLRSPDRLAQMQENALTLAVPDRAARLATLVRQMIESK
ncbi:MAG: undecaprenyldiphospho-muramoylpentapeptide beta-N-acetylglucosaminyltransferase [Hormoscilla sp. GM7CHS1pb]|nr:undecaprenyldiphospho-muramoylpentapeptide beta-N-acetylglucosaminyltransferase [Hormoscilla sp. GM7CHS1pb]